MIDSRTWIWWRRQAARALLVNAALVLAVCGESPTETPQVATDPVGAQPSPPESGPDADDDGLSLVPAGVPLPFRGSVNSSGAAFKITQTGTGVAGEFVKSGDGASSALLAQNSGAGGVATFHQTNLGNVPAVSVLSRGSGTSLSVTQTGGGNAGLFVISNTASPADALVVSTNGTGRAAFFRKFTPCNPCNPVLEATTSQPGNAGLFSATGNAFYPGNALRVESNRGIASLQASNSAGGPAGHFFGYSRGLEVVVGSSGTRTALLVNHTGPSGDIAIFQSEYDNVARIDKTGRGFFNGGTLTGGADVAEALGVEGAVAGYEPGDVLVISTRADRRVTTTRARYSTQVAGVYATRPGVLLTERGIDDPLTGLVPVGVLGVIPTKVSAENGAIRRGDILVTASRPGHAMRATPIVIQGVLVYPTGAILGRALEEFRGPGTGRIRVLVNVK